MGTKTQTIKNRINSDLRDINTSYHPQIPLDEIFEIVKTHAGQVVQEDGTPWSGLLCGEDDCANMQIEGMKFSLRLSWHKMPSGNWEITAYVS